MAAACKDSPDGEHEPQTDEVTVHHHGTERVVLVSACRWCGKMLSR